MHTVELVLAVVSGLCGLAASGAVAGRLPALAGFLSGIGLFLCNVIWVLRLT